MSTLTAKEIQGDFLAIVKASPLATAISGAIYRDGLRPRDSRLEDITVAFVSGLTNQIQTGVIALCIYVPDIDPFGNGILVEDGARTDALARVAQSWLDGNPAADTNYLVTQQATITTLPAADINQHFVSVMLQYRLFNEK